jgi:preprotein translocase subunit SecG
MLAHGYQVISFLATVVLIVVALVGFVLLSRDKPKALAWAFAAACFGLSGFLLYLVLVPHL